MMKKMILLVVLVAAVGGCKKKKAEEGHAAGGAGEAMGAGSGSGMAGGGSGMAGGGSGSEMMGSGSAGGTMEAAKPMTPEDLAKRYDECSGYLNDHKLDKFADCVATDAVIEMPGSPMPALNGRDAILAHFKDMEAAFPDEKTDAQLVLVNGKTIIGVRLMTGTNSGAMKTPMGEMPATNKKMGLYFAHVLETEDNHMKHEWAFMDVATMMGQLKPDPKHPARPVVDKLAMAKEVVIAKNDDKEKANLATMAKALEAFNKHDVKAVGDLLADDVVWSVAAAPKDLNKKETLAHDQEQWKAFSDVKLTATQQWAAGDYVASVVTFEGTNDGDMPSMHIKKTGKKLSVPVLAIHKLDGGKIKAAWLFFQGMAIPMQLGLMPPPGAPPADGAPKMEDKKGEPKKGEPKKGEPKPKK